VLDIVESQIFSRMRERLVGWEHQQPTCTTAPESGNRAQAYVRRPYRQPLTGENCTVLRTDVVAFSADERNDEDRAIIRRATADMTHLALGATRGLCRCEDRGDGHLIIAPPSIPTAEAITRLSTVLSRKLKRHNRIYSDSIRVQLRLAVDVGPVTEDATGVSGKAIIAASRMLDAPAFKEAIARNGAILGIIVSPFVYETAIRQVRGLSEAAGYTKILVEVKETRTSAWMHLIDPGEPAFLARQQLTRGRRGRPRQGRPPPAGEFNPRAP
jgi:class 3 adenylate cyclase